MDGRAIQALLKHSASTGQVSSITVGELPPHSLLLVVAGTIVFVLDVPWVNMEQTIRLTHVCGAARGHSQRRGASW